MLEVLRGTHSKWDNITFCNVYDSKKETITPRILMIYPSNILHFLLSISCRLYTPLQLGSSVGLMHGMVGCIW